MSAITSIQWTDRTWNPVRGCSVVSPGCHNCYAMKQAHRFNAPGKPYEGLTKATKAGPQWTGVVRLAPERVLMEPYSWRKPQRIFVNSMSDLFHESLTNEQIAEVFYVMYGEASTVAAPEHTYQILTKRPERMRDWFQWLREYNGPDATIEALAVYLRLQGPHPRVWLGVSCEDRDRLFRIDILKDIPAAVHFVSFEPLLEDLGALLLDAIEWAIVGGESGHKARPCDVKWIRSIVHQCKAQGVSCFVKQLGAHVLDPPPGPAHAIDRFVVGGWRRHFKDSHGGDSSEWPEDLRIREFPKQGSLSAMFQ